MEEKRLLLAKRPIGELKSLSLKAKESKWLPDTNINKIDAKESKETKAKELATREEKEEEEEEEEEWVAEPEPGVLITLVPLGDEGNFIKKIRFSVERFDAMEAQKWWSENYDRLMELYCICLPPSPYQSNEDELDSGEVQLASTSQSSNEQSNAICEDQEHPEEVQESSKAASTKGIKGKVVKWVIEDESGVFLTIRSLPDDTKEIVRVELCRERFGDVNAKLWWEENKTSRKLSSNNHKLQEPERRMRDNGERSGKLNNPVTSEFSHTANQFDGVNGISNAHGGGKQLSKDSTSLGKLRMALLPRIRNAARSYARAASTAVSKVPSQTLDPRRLGLRISAANFPHGRCLTPRYFRSSVNSAVG
ncbi:hypothetical protein HPP92_014912 [Vanilla planifolia]|uniref:BRX domain-containing protein n=1 Tax=Vanilla planifolia TaxID=51239 RepID=A0A835QMH6_VANPL|nr:hypothetical protein HPP92_014912 [Vanilla planifolia]